MLFLAFYDGGQALALFRFTALAFLTAAVLLPQSAYAADKIEFIAKDAFTDIAARSIVQSHDFAEISAIDLNEDGLDEFILKGDAFRIFAQNDGKVVELGTIEAHKLMLSYNRVHGVRSILAFSDASNDYDYDVYQWDINSLKYVHKAKSSLKSSLGGKI